VTVEVDIREGKECWARTFGTQRLVTHQWLRDGLLLEASGPACFGFRMTSDTEGMQFTFARFWLLGLPLPHALSPRINAFAREQGAGWWLQVRMEVPVLGLITQYEGLVIPQGVSEGE
jgi:hypothetical protein